MQFLHNHWVGQKLEGRLYSDWEGDMKSKLDLGVDYQRAHKNQDDSSNKQGRGIGHGAITKQKAEPLQGYACTHVN